MDFIRFQTLGMIVGLMTGNQAALASTRAANADFYEIGRVRMEVVEEESEQATSLPRAEEKGGKSLNQNLDDLDVAIDKIINLGRKVWSIVEANKPVVNFSAASANAVPQGVRDWTDLEKWSTPKARVYRVIYENPYGIDVIDFRFRVVYTYGGSFQGHGRYLSNVTVVPVDLSVIWGFNFDARVSVPGVVNLGTKESPVAGMQINLEWTVKTALQYRQSTTSYFVTGAGALTDLSRGTR